MKIMQKQLDMDSHSCPVAQPSVWKSCLWKGMKEFDFIKYRRNPFLATTINCKAVANNRRKLILLSFSQMLQIKTKIVITNSLGLGLILWH